MRIFLDIGAHNGQTVEVVLRPEHEFDLVYAFEPMPLQYKIMTGRYGGDPRLIPCEFGLWGETGRFPVYGTNDRMEASTYESNVNADSTVVTECDFVNASDWFRSTLPEEATIIAKINVEGAECDILDDLLDSGQIHRLAALTVAFDVGGVVGYEHRQGEIEQRLREAGIDWVDMDDWVGATHDERVTNWLASADPR